MDPSKIIPFFEGNRTYLVAFLNIAYLIACQFLDKEPSPEILGIFNSLGLIFLRSGVEKSGPIFPPVPTSTIPSSTPKLP